jgi:glycosyltransferase involved in cell wall biosynthesis
VPGPEHVVLNALFLAPGVSGGPETYLRGLAPALASEFPALRQTIVTTQSGAQSLRADGFGDFAAIVGLRCEDGQRLRRQFAEQVLLPMRGGRLRADIVHSLASIAPLRAGAPRAVVTIHDVTFMREPTFGALTTFGMEVLVRSAARRADGLITGTAAARDDICARLGVDPQRFTVVHHGHERPHAGAPTPEAQLQTRFGLDAQARIVLCVAAKRPHKNQELLLRAATELPDDVVILLVGHAEPYEATLRALAAELGVAERVRFVDYLADADLEGLWGIVACAAQPTLGEGFGLPVLEALAHGVAVAASDIPVLREVGGELAHYFDPHDATAAAAAIGLAMADETTRESGPRRAEHFSWTAAARGTHGVYERVLCTSG